MPESSLFQYSVVNYIMLSKHSFVRQKLRLIGSTSFGFAQNPLHDFQNTVYELIVELSSAYATKTR